MCLRASFLLACLCLLLSPVLSQETNIPSHSCGISHSIKTAIKEEGYQKRLTKYNNRIAEVAAKQLKSNTETPIPCPNGITIIPIAFHLFHEKGAEIGESHNFSLRQLNLVVDYLNMHFSGVNPRKRMLGDQFSKFDAGNTCIQFTIGKINRIDTETCEHWAKNETQYQLHKCLPGGSGVGSENDPNDFLNLYVTELHGGLLGQASNIPGILGSSNSKSDGITISRNIIIPGESNKTLYDKGGILAHEIGHWLGLAHVDGDIQGSGCEGDDGLEDTYPQERKNTYVCSEAIPQSCGTPDNVFNFMDYSMDCAKLMFTKQQAAIMNYVLSNDRKGISKSFLRMDRSNMLYDFETQNQYSTPIEWVKIECQERINLLEFQQKWTKRHESQQGISGTKNYYWEKNVSASSQKNAQILDERYLSEHNALSGLEELNGNSVVILRLKEEIWNVETETYEPSKTRGIILIVVSPCPSPINDKISNAILLNQGTLCNDDSYSLLYSNSEIDKTKTHTMSLDSDVWFKMNTGSYKEMIDLIIKRPNSSADDPILEAFTMDMKPLILTRKESLSETLYSIDKNEGVSAIYIRAFDTDQSVADPFQLCRLNTAALNDNCPQAYQVPVLKHCEWLGYSFKDSNPSTEEEAGYNCGSDRELYDVWFETTVPKSGYFSVKCKNKVGIKNDILLEVYAGTCSNKELLGCQMVYGISGSDPMAYLPFVGMTPGQKIFIRVGGRGYGQKGDFELCVSQSFKNICTISKIDLGSVLNCNAETDSYSQEISVSYQSTGALNKLIVNGQYFTLIENPQKVILRNIPSNKPLTIKAHLLNLEDPTCWSNSSYSIESIYQNNLPCQEEEKKNDVCLEANLIDVGCSTTTFALDNNSASSYSSEGGCISKQRDEWFEVIVPISGAIEIEIPENKNDESNLVAEVYRGACNNMELITCIHKDESGLLVTELNDLQSGEILYIRVAEMKGEFQESISICISDPQLAEFRSIISPNAADENMTIEKNIGDNIAIQCFPNPTTDYVNINIAEFDEKLEHKVSMVDNNGRIISESKIHAGQQRLDLSSLESGLYLLKIQTGTRLITKKVIKA